MSDVDINQVSVDITTKMDMLSVNTARLEGGEGRPSSISIGSITVPELGGRMLMIGVVDGEGVGANALLTAEDFQKVIQKLCLVAVEAGLMMVDLPIARSGRKH